MEIRHLKLVQAVAEAGSLTKAASSLFVSQSALSHQLKEIETYLNAQLFIRQNKRMILTREGEVILMASKKILSELDNATKSLKLMADKDAGEIRISTECYTSYPWLSRFLNEFNPLYPKVEVTIISDATRFALANLLDNRIDIGIFENNKHRAVAYTPLFNDEFYIIVHPSHPWAKKSYIDMHAVGDEPYIMYTMPVEESTMYQLLFPKTAPRKLYKIMVTEAIIEMVKSGLGFTVMPNWIVYPYVESGELSAIRINRNGLKRTWYAGVLKSRQVPPYMQSFMHKLAKHMKYCAEMKITRRVRSRELI